MDKNFIKIDDLVRRRLEGAEEKERPGSWLNMKELLDKEMPQVRPVGMLYWRRIFSAAAVVALLGGLGLGGYKLSSYVALNDGADHIAPVAKADPANHIANVVKNNENNAALSGNGVVDNEPSADKTSAKTIALVKTNHKTASSTHTITNTTLAAKESVTNSTASVNNVAAPVAAVPVKVAADLPKATVTKIQGANNGVTPVAKKADIEKDAIAKTVNADMASLNNNAVKANVSEPAVNTVKAPVDVPAKNTIADNSNTHKISTAAAIADRMIDAENASVLKKDKRTMDAKLASTKVVPVNKIPLAAGSGTKVNVSQPAADPAKEITIANQKRGKRVIGRLELHEHYIKTSESEGHFTFDTISMNSRTEEYTIKNENNLAEEAGDEDNAAPAGSKLPAAKNAQILPAAAPSSSSKTTTDSKDLNSMKKGTETKKLEKLTSAFNDIKNKVAAVQFAPGLTGGINGTFFGPGVFTGFQFGLTGNFIFNNNNLSVLTELKYFHRINGNYAISDDYYSYTPDGTGGYTRELQQNLYNFSTMHSIELPVSLNYRAGNFYLFAGGNFTYSFAVNTESDPLPVAGTATTVSAIGTDNAPKLNTNDFNSRFGFGYLVGMSYQLSPNMSLDFRSVQTIWDNANTTGSRSVSTKLYKNPSFQVSFGYRLGNHKPKE